MTIRERDELGLTIAKAICGAPFPSLASLRKARAAIAAYERERGLQDGGPNVVVPREPTEAMLIAAHDWSGIEYGKPIGNDAASDCYRAMLAAGDKP